MAEGLKFIILGWFQLKDSWFNIGNSRARVFGFRAKIMLCR